jgi:hypothetical protein
MKRVRVSVEIAEMGDFEVASASTVSSEDWSVDLRADATVSDEIMENVIAAVSGFRF